MLLGRGCRRGARFRAGGEDRVKGVGKHRPHSSASWAENTIMTECPQESGHLQSTCSLVSGSVEGKAHVLIVQYIDSQVDICVDGKIPLQI